MKLTWFGTASLAVEAAGGRLLIDPFLPLPGSETQVDPMSYAGYDTILVTHGHFDHILSLPELVRGTDARLYRTETPRVTLARKGVNPERLMRIAPGDVLELEGMTVSVFQSRHVRYDRPLLRRTLLNARMLRYARNLPVIIREFFGCPENRETVGFLIEADGRRVFAMGSLNLDPQTEYPREMDVLALPYQGASDLTTPALQIVDRLRPRAVLLDHFDDAFPPISASVDTSDIEAALRGVVPVIRPRPGEIYEF